MATPHKQPSPRGCPPATALRPQRALPLQLLRRQWWGRPGLPRHRTPAPPVIGPAALPAPSLAPRGACRRRCLLGQRRCRHLQRERRAAAGQDGWWQPPARQRVVRECRGWVAGCCWAATRCCGAPGFSSGKHDMGAMHDARPLGHRQRPGLASLAAGLLEGRLPHALPLHGHALHLLHGGLQLLAAACTPSSDRGAESEKRPAAPPPAASALLLRAPPQQRQGRKGREAARPPPRAPAPPACNASGTAGTGDAGGTRSAAAGTAGAHRCRWPPAATACPAPRGALTPPPRSTASLRPRSAAAPQCPACRSAAGVKEGGGGR
jgi:hypothetical protein